MSTAAMRAMSSAASMSPRVDRAVVPGSLLSAIVLDTGICVRFREGDPEAVRAVYRAYGHLVHAVAWRVLGDRGLAEEATQQTFLRAWQASLTFDLSRELAPWLATIARRVAVDIYRRESRRAHDSIDDVASDAPAVVTLPPSVDSVYDAWEVRQAVAELPADEEEVVRLQHLSGLTHREIAERLRVPIGTVKSRSFRAHRRLAGRLGHLQESLT